MPSEAQQFQNSDDFKFFGLGGCNEVGRSSHIIEYKNKVIMLDAGVHPGLSGLNSLPFYDEYDLSKVDILLISHFHLDHAASLPYVMQHTNFQGRVFMTHATKAIYRWLLSDFVKVTSLSGTGDSRGINGESDSGGNLYTDDDLIRSFDRIETIDYHSTIEIDGIRFTAYHAGHVLGACMYFIEIGGLKVLFTGDYSSEEDRHLQVAEVPPMKPDILITESTFGTATHEPKLEKEKRMTNVIHSTLLKGGRVLMPVFALGRAQELLLILEEYWSQNEELQNINIYYASSLARKCMAVYQTYTNIMNDKIRLRASAAGSSKASNPFQFKYIKSIRNLDKFQDFGPSVVVASPGMLQNGVSRELLEKWAPDPKNAVIMTGYSVEGTMAKDLLAEPHTIQSATNSDITIPCRLNIEEISFAAHVDFQQNAEFIDQVNPSNIILVHGESNPMGRLKSALLSKYSGRKGTENEVKVFNPRNCDELFLPIKGMKIAKVLGSLAEEQLSALKLELQEKLDKQNIKIEEIEEKNDTNIDSTESKPSIKEENDMKKDSAQSNVSVKEESEQGEIIRSIEPVSGVLVSKDFDLSLVQLQDLHEFTQLSTSIVKSKIHLSIISHISLIKWHLEQMFGSISVLSDDEDTWECLIMEMIKIVVEKNKSQTSHSILVYVEWINDNLISDSIADSVVAILYSIDSSPASVKMSSHTCSHGHSEPKIKRETEGEEMEIIQEDAEDENASISASSNIANRIHRISTLLKAQFGTALKTLPDNKATITIGKNEAQIDLLSLSVKCNSRVLKDRIENVMKRGCVLAAPLSKPQK